jgi:hypothetical protein
MEGISLKLGLVERILERILKENSVKMWNVYLAQKGIRWQVLVNTLINVQFP